MEQETRTINLNTERAFRYTELAKVYGKKVTFNIRTLILDVPKERKMRRAARKYKWAARKAEGFDISILSDRVQAELVYQYYRYSILEGVYLEAKEKYSDYYASLKKELKRLRAVKGLKRWRLRSNRKKTKLYEKARELNSIYHKEYMEDINRLLRLRVKAINARKLEVWTDYLKNPKPLEAGLEEYMSRGRGWKKQLKTGLNELQSPKADGQIEAENAAITETGNAAG